MFLQVVECLLEEMEGLQTFHSMQKILSLRDLDTIIALLRHRLMHDAMAEKLIQNKQCANQLLVDEMDELLHIKKEGSESADMDVEGLNPMATPLTPLNLSSVEKFMDSFKGTGDMMFASFNIDNSHPVSEDLMKDIACYIHVCLEKLG